MLSESEIEHVAPLAGAWIETGKELAMLNALESLPSRERGLKQQDNPCPLFQEGRSPRGSVD